jgi:hypothetical protein
MHTYLICVLTKKSALGASTHALSHTNKYTINVFVCDVICFTRNGHFSILLCVVYTIESLIVFQILHLRITVNYSNSENEYRHFMLNFTGSD